MCGSLYVWEYVHVCECVHVWESVHVGVCDVWGGVHVLMLVLSLGHHSFELHTFEKPFYCDACSKLLYGCYFQGYLCSGIYLVLLLLAVSSPFIPTLPPLHPPHTHYRMQEDCP